jgi:2,5-diamino-6-(ribosylamino)-4(3H)-pyrimidinone 5'-phosphate reductase
VSDLPDAGAGIATVAEMAGHARVQTTARYGVEMVHLDSGGVLSGVLLRAGLVDEVNLLIHPCLAGGPAPSTMFHEPDATTTCDGQINLKLMHIEQMRDEIAWLRYEVVKQTGPPLS